VVEPPLPALLGSAEEPAVGVDEERLSEIAPLEAEVVPAHQRFEEFVLLVDPFLVLVVFLQQVLPLVYEELLRLRGEELGEERPVVAGAVFGLSKEGGTRSWMSIRFSSA
jgi:hypothetical protein